jgi:hypothetical protein
VLQDRRNYDIINESLPPRYRRPLAARLTEADIGAARARVGGDDRISGSSGGP